jgi:hypothetical protein
VGGCRNWSNSHDAGTGLGGQIGALLSAANAVFQNDTGVNYTSRTGVEYTIF